MTYNERLAQLAEMMAKAYVGVNGMNWEDYKKTFPKSAQYDIENCLVAAEIALTFAAEMFDEGAMECHIQTRIEDGETFINDDEMAKYKTNLGLIKTEV